MSALPRKSLTTGGPSVSRLCLGTMMFGDQTDEAEAGRILDAYFAAGGNFIDTADAYASGRSEEMLGRLLGARGDDAVLATKVGNKVGGVADSGGISPRWIAEAARQSLDRLQTKSIDLYYLHLDDNETPLDDVVGALGQLLADGKIKAWGFSNFRPWKIADLVHIADRLGVARPIAAQPYYHVLNRVIESDLLPACAHFDIGTVTYSPLARGVLTGKYRNGATPEGSRAARADVRMMETEFRPETVSAANRAADYAEASNRNPGGLALNWVLANQLITSVLAGPKTLAQLQGYLDAFGMAYTADDEAFLDGLCGSGCTPNPGYTDPRYPLRGRVTDLG